MSLRAIVTLGVYASLVPLVGATGTWTGPLSAAAFVDVQAPAADDTRALPIHAGQVERRDAGSGLQPAIEGALRGTTDRLWIAWAVPAVSRPGGGWSDRSDGRCVLDDDGNFHDGNFDGSTTTLIVLVRATAGAIDRVAFTDGRCVVDAGSRRVIWLDHVAVQASARLLADLVRRDAAGASASADDDRSNRAGRRALPALALHDDPAVDATLTEFVAAGEPDWLRRDAAFWLAVARGQAGAAVVERLARSDTDDRFREHLTFVLTLIASRGLDTLIDLARHDASSRVRGQALFWIGQKAGERATATLAHAVDDDPNADVRKKAVFAISQLPKDESVPTLIQLAKTHRDPEVRRQAMFWLGQSGDPRALAFFEAVLEK